MDSLLFFLFYVLLYPLQWMDNREAKKYNRAQARREWISMEMDIDAKAPEAILVASRERAI